MWNKAHQGFSPQSAFDELKMSPRVTRMKSSFLSSLLFSIRCFRFSSTLSFFFLSFFLQRVLPCSEKRGTAPSRLRTRINLGHQFVENRNLSSWIWIRSIPDLLRRKWLEGSSPLSWNNFQKDEDSLSLYSLFLPLSLQTRNHLIQTSSMINREQLAWFNIVSRRQVPGSIIGIHHRFAPREMGRKWVNRETDANTGLINGQTYGRVRMMANVE